ncbi:MAG: class I SAM-dependent methyltransferase [Gammaproteobacteria bacterium]|nr:class I SAM-dependent methyltransferase [Gammaproteobacteria bacterium]
MSETPSKYTLPPHPVLKDYYVDEGARKARVKSLFNDTAKHYDWINRMMSFGTGERYRLEALERAGLKSGQSVMDVGCGTGVLARHEMDVVGPEGLVVGVDPSEGMLAEAVNRGVSNVAMGRGECLPLADQSVDFVSMGYALRHVSDLAEAFTEYQRVLKPGGTLLLLEIAPPKSRLGYQLIKFYMKYVIPLITRLGTRDRSAQVLMSYYWDTVEQCVEPNLILEALGRVGFEQPKRHVLFGIFGEYTAKRPNTV